MQLTLSNYTKGLLVFSNTVLFTNTAVEFFSPNGNLETAWLLIAYATVASVLTSVTSESDWRFRWFPESLENKYNAVVLEASERYTVDVDGIAYAADVIAKFSATAVMSGLLLISAYRFTEGAGTVSYFSRVRQFLIASVFVNLPFIAGPEVIVLFFFFFFTMYFSELHAFFIYTLGLSSDSLVYQFNFLLAGFSFIFFFKFYRNLNTSGIFFSFVTLLHSNLNFVSARVTGGLGVRDRRGSAAAPLAFVRAGASIFVISYYIFFFLTTFIV